MNEKRLFISLGFTIDFVKSIEPWVKKIKKTSDRKDVFLKWTPPENYHVTLVFLGNTPVERIAEIKEKMQKVASQHTPFNLKVRNISGFPTITQARVIYVGIQRSQLILDLQSQMEAELKRSEDYENDYTPHLTIARLRNPKSCKDLLSPFEHIDLGKQKATSLILYNSILSDGYPIYEKIFETDLIAAPIE